MKTVAGAHCFRGICGGFAIKMLQVQSDDDPFDYRGLVAVWDESQRRDRLGYDKVCLFAYGYGAESVAYPHCIGGIDGACIERLLRGEPHLYTSQSHHETHVAART